TSTTAWPRGSDRPPLTARSCRGPRRDGPRRRPRQLSSLLGAVSQPLNPTRRLTTQPRRRLAPPGQWTDPPDTGGPASVPDLSPTGRGTRSTARDRGRRR